MHYRMLVTVSMPEGATSDDARQNVWQTLLVDQSFCGEGGRFGTPLCDWFVIGGRFSGVLSETLIGESFKAAVIARFPQMAEAWWPCNLLEHHSAELTALWREHGGISPSPYERDNIDDYGHTDDAMPVCARLYKALLSAYEDHDTFNGDFQCEFADLDGEVVDPSFIGRKWLVVVDYHN